MTTREPTFTLGIEEEYLLVDRDSRDAVNDPPREIFEQCAKQAEHGAVDHELLRSQIETETRVCETVAEARHELAELRRLAHDVSAQYNIAPIAASTHPFAEWHAQHSTDKQRYHALFRDMQTIARRMLICGTHVHVGIENDELRLELLNQFSQFLPLLLALSTSSPFWQGENTGLKSFRLTVFDNFPRTGLPEQFRDYHDYQQHMKILEKAEVIQDPTFIWWDMRISARYPTLECRIADMCTRLDDAISLAALTQSILHYLYRMKRDRKTVPVYSRFLVDQNRWRAIRYGVDEGLLDLASEKVIPVNDWLESIAENVYRDAEELGCVKELEQALDIPKNGTSAHKQIATYEQACAAGKAPIKALHDVVDMLIEETVKEL
jgi:carboxylate-amine ligase